MTLTDKDLRKLLIVIRQAVKQEFKEQFANVVTKQDLDILAEDQASRYLRVFETKTDHQESFAELKSLLQNMPSKEEFFNRMDKLSGEYKKIDEAQTIQSNQLSELEDKLEKHLTVSTKIV